MALDELVLHGWDVDQATGQAYECEPAILEALYQFVAPLAVPGQEAQGEGLFGPVIEVPEGAPLLDRVIGLSGRDPAWVREPWGDEPPGGSVRVVESMPVEDVEERPHPDSPIPGTLPQPPHP